MKIATLEKILASLFALSFILNLFGIHISGQLSIISAGSLAFFYPYGLKYMLTGESLTDFFKKASFKSHRTHLKNNGAYLIIVGACLAVLTIYILFEIMYWPNAFRIVGFPFSIVLIIYTVIKYLKGKEDTYKKTLIRLVLWTVIASIFYLMPKYTIIQFKYRDNPTYRDALINSMENPQDTVAHRKWVEESKKLNE